MIAHLGQYWWKGYKNDCVRLHRWQWALKNPPMIAPHVSWQGNSSHCCTCSNPCEATDQSFCQFPSWCSIWICIPNGSKLLPCNTFLLDWQLHRNSRNTRIHAFSDTNWARLKKNTYLWQIMSNQEWICWHNLEHKITNPNGFLNNHLRCKIINPNRFLNTIFNTKLPTLMDFLTLSWTQNYKPEGIS